MTLIKAWTSQKFIEFSHWLTSAFGLGVDSDQIAITPDTWTPDTLAHFGLEMSKGFGPGL